MKTTLTGFIQYLENLASLNVDVKHHPDTHPAFIRFYEADETESAVRNKVKHLPCVMVKDYDFYFRDNRSDNLHKVREIEFLVVDQIGRSTSDVYAVWERTEEIGDEFIIKMKDDKRKMKTMAIINFDLDGVRGVPVDMQTGGLYATSYTVPISSVRSNDPDPTKWLEE
jgi:hypothetical protein